MLFPWARPTEGLIAPASAATTNAFARSFLDITHSIEIDPLFGGGGIAIVRGAIAAILAVGS